MWCCLACAVLVLHVYGCAVLVLHVYGCAVLVLRVFVLTCQRNLSLLWPQDSVAVAAALIDAGAPLHSVAPPRYGSPLHCAATHCRPAVVELLLSRGGPRFVGTRLYSCDATPLLHS